MLTIVEGPDNSGKTTLARRLAKDLEMLYMWRGFKPKDKTELILFETMLIPLAKEYNVICDRWPAISDAIYGPIIRKQTVIEKDEVRLSYIPIGSTVIYCCPPLSVLMAPTEPQMEGVMANIKVIQNDYWKFMATIKHYKYDWTDRNHSYEDVRRFISSRLEVKS